VKAGPLGNVSRIPTYSRSFAYLDHPQLTEIWNRHPPLHPLYSRSQMFDHQDSLDLALLVDPLDTAREWPILLDDTYPQSLSTDYIF
jgi:hypothetical protein